MSAFLIDQAKVTILQWMKEENDPAWQPVFETLERLLRPHASAGSEGLAGIYVLFAMLGVPGFSLKRAILTLHDDPNADPLDAAIMLDCFSQDQLNQIAHKLLDVISRSKKLNRWRALPGAFWREGFLVFQETLLDVDLPEEVCEVFVPDWIEKIDHRALYGCPDIRRISLPAKLKPSGLLSALQEAENLERVMVREGERGYFSSYDGVLYNKNSLLCCPPAHAPGCIVRPGTRSIDFDAFMHCRKLERILLPDGLECILDGAFYGCTALKKITMPGSLTYLSREAFQTCPNLREVTFMGRELQLEEEIFDEGANILIRAPGGSAAEAYARELGLPFETLEEEDCQ